MIQFQTITKLKAISLIRQAYNYSLRDAFHIINVMDHKWSENHSLQNVPSKAEFAKLKRSVTLVLKDKKYALKDS